MPDFDNTNRGILFINDRKQSDKHPDYKGSINVDGKEFWLSAWMKQTTKGDAISLSIEPKEAQASSSTVKPKASPTPAVKPAPKPAPSFNNLDDEAPF